MIAALARGDSRLKNFSNSADCATTLGCLQELGVQIERRDSEVIIHGLGENGLRSPAGALDCGNSGTTMRLLAGILAGQKFKSVLIGDESLQTRPMQRIIEPLQMMGANVSSQDGRAPLTIDGHWPLTAINYELLVASAQVKSCILLAGLAGQGRTQVTENEITRDHTERMLRWFNLPIEVGPGDREGSRRVAVAGPALFNARDVSIPGDISSAAYFIAAAALVPGSSLEIDEVGINPTRAMFLKQLRSFGLEVVVSNAREESNEPLGIIRVEGSKSRPVAGSESAVILHSALIPQLIDELPLLAVVGSQIEGGIEIRDAAELRAKESDRIATTARNLRAMGAEVEELADGLRVAGPKQLRGAPIVTRGDHRIAMAFTVAGLIAEGETEIEDEDCVAISFPEFFDLLESVVER
jgi:3-phosphoshikimate 1-carboxyvinyltransferase